MRKYKRSQRVADQIKREVSSLVDKSTADKQFGMVSVTDVSLTDDLRHAKIFVSRLSLTGNGADGASRGDDDGNEDCAVRFLNDRCKRIRSALAQKINIKFVPDITFVYDSSIERGMKIESILDDIARRRTGSAE